MVAYVCQPGAKVSKVGGTYENPSNPPGGWPLVREAAARAR